MNIADHPDVALAVGVIGILGVMIVPLPTAILDLLLAVNISFSLVVLVNALYVTAPLELSVFPSLMLVVTLFRLSLNVASTRLILGQGYAGEMIGAFGSFVVKDNYIVGFVIFLILVAIQYLVVVRGTERNAEVGARFTLDAMPGKQMSIDADLNAGLINEEEALRRRKDLSREANFYGAMDGAAKFVRGDAIAGIVITLVNIVAGFGVGMLQMGMGAGESLRTYTRLTIGDGLVSQIPALIISTAAGIVVSRSSAASSLGKDLGTELFSKHKPLLVVSGTLVALALIPGIPTLPLMIMAGGILLVARASLTRHRKQEETPAPAPPARRDEGPEEYLKLDRLEVAIGYGLIPLIDQEGGSDFLDRVLAMRRQLAGDLGIIVPRIRVRDDIRLKPDHYQIRIKGSRVATGAIAMGHHLAIGAENLLDQIDGVETKEPAFGLRAKWITGSAKSRAEDLGLTVVGASVVLATHLTEVVRSHAWEIVTRQDVQFLMDELKKDAPAVVEDVVPQVISLGTVHRVLQNLLKERVGIRDLSTILEILGDFGPQVKEVDVLTEYVRAGLSRAISSSAVGPERKLHVVSLDPAVEHMISQAAREGGQGLGTALPPAESQLLLKKLEGMVKSILDRQQRPAILCAPQVRLAIRRMTEATFPTLPVLSYHEIAPDVDVYSVGILAVEDELEGVPMDEIVPAMT
ncbi:MAG: flagellar biosynthesis protein FlhA [Candidatus Eisenbacteria sp.]|nr:flagellar biosynthesis protein FlhA [Candidatus Eisenbacteria bacterium]